MPKPPRVSGIDTIRALERLGFLQIRQQGSHIILKKQTPNGEIGCVVPLAEIDNLIKGGEITHSLAISGFHYLSMKKIKL